MTPHPDFQSFFQVLRDNPGLFSEYQADVYRQSLPRWMSRPYRFTGLGSVFIGGRWSVKGLTPTVYASTHPQTLVEEAYYKCSRYGWVPENFITQLTIQMRWQLRKVLDLTNPNVQTTLSISQEAILLCDWEADQQEGKEALTQAIARAAFENLAEALVVPSARKEGGINVVFFPTHRQAESITDAVKEGEIPFMHGL